jgi:hypothetical protein
LKTRPRRSADEKMLGPCRQVRPECPIRNRTARAEMCERTRTKVTKAVLVVSTGHLVQLDRYPSKVSALSAKAMEGPRGRPTNRTRS